MAIRCEFVHIVRYNSLLWNLISLLGHYVNIWSVGNTVLKIAICSSYSIPGLQLGLKWLQRIGVDFIEINYWWFLTMLWLIKTVVIPVSLDAFSGTVLLGSPFWMDFVKFGKYEWISKQCLCINV